MTGDEPDGVVLDSTTLRFAGAENSDNAVHDLRAAHVAEVLQGLVELTSDFAKAGAFDAQTPVAPEVLVRPPQEGSFVIEVLKWVQDNPGTAALAGTFIGGPTLGQIITWSTKSIRAGVQDFEHLDNGNVKVTWQDNTAQEIPKPAWDELNKRKRRRKAQLRKIMAPLSDKRVESVDVSAPKAPLAPDATPPVGVVLTRSDYDAMRPEDKVEQRARTFTVEAQMSAVDFDDPARWRVRTKESNRLATLVDKEFLGRVANGLAIRKNDIFRLRIREDVTKKNGRSSKKWTVLEVEKHKRGAHDDDSQQQSAS